MRQIPDLMLCLQDLNEGTVRQIRKTAEDPPRASVIDTIVVITGQSQANSATHGRGCLRAILKFVSR